MHISAPAILLSVRAHGEHGAIARALTEAHGVQPGYVRGGHSRRLRPALQPGNTILGDWRARTDEQLPGLTLELGHSRAGLHGEPLAAAALEWAVVATAAALPDAQPYPRIHAGLSALLDAIEAAPAARGWAAALARYELLLLAELGFGLALDECVVTGGTADLGWVSPKSGGAVSRDAAAGYEAKLFRLPAFLGSGGAADGPEILDALAITGHFVARDILTGRSAEPLAARERLVDRLRRAIG